MDTYLPYTGIGARKTPANIRLRMTKLAYKLEKANYTLRSGGADGADLAFEIGVSLSGPKEIYLPWKGFNNSQSLLFTPSDEAFYIAAKIHPAWSKLKDSHKKLHARNIHQVLGKNLNAPSKFLICWTENVEDVGGTRTAIICARENNIEIHNLFDETNKIKF